MIAGAAKIDVTPKEKVWMDGMIRAHQSEGVHDPLFARALYISPGDDPGSAFVVVSVDVCGISAADALAVRRAVESRTGVPAGHVVIAASHTHSGPATVGFFNETEDEYVRELVNKLITVATCASDSARPAAAGVAVGRENTISHYRRLLGVDGRVIMNWEPYTSETIVGPMGEPDNEVSVLKIVDAENPDDIICILFNQVGHPNVMSGENFLISGDYPGFAANLLEEEFNCSAMFVNGAQGSVDIDGLRDRDWEGVSRTGTALAKAVAEIAGGIMPSESASVSGSYISYELASRKISDSELAWAEEVLRQTGGTVQILPDGVGDDYKAKLYKGLRAVQGRDLLVEQTCVAVDDMAFVSFPGELFTEIGMNIKAGSPFRHTCVIGLANGYIGYIPTQKAVKQGGYEVDTRRADASAEDIILGYTIPLLRNVHHQEERNANIREVGY